MTKGRIASAAALLWLLTASIGAAPQPAAEPGDELPDGAGKEILKRACRSCHDLGEVTKFKDYWTRQQWRDAVDTMIAYGAEVKDDEARVLTDYLVQHLGKKEGK